MQGNRGGQGANMGGRGRGGGTGQGLGGMCSCPNCGYSEAHQRSVPCFERKCPKCNTPLVRGN